MVAKVLLYSYIHKGGGKEVCFSVKFVDAFRIALTEEPNLLIK